MKAFHLDAIHDAFAFEALTITTSGLSLTPTVFTSASPPGRIAQYALITVENAPIRWRADGTVPTTSNGHLLNINDTLELVGSNNLKRSLFVATSSSATLMVSYAY